MSVTVIKFFFSFLRYLFFKHQPAFLQHQKSQIGCHETSPPLYCRKPLHYMIANKVFIVYRDKQMIEEIHGFFPLHNFSHSLIFLFTYPIPACNLLLPLSTGNFSKMLPFIHQKYSKVLLCARLRRCRNK